MSVRKHPLAECEKCPLREGSKYVATKFPKPSTSEHSRLAVVGEAPGVQESYVGIPFVGPSGKLLTRVLDHHGIDRSTVILTNATLCRPEDNATPPAAAVAACRPRLLQDLQDVEQVLALGNTAAQSILGTKVGITSLRVGPPKIWQDKLVVASIHPAACLRQGDMFPHLVNDVGKLIRRQPEWTPPNYIVVDTEEQALEAIEQLHTIADTLVVDIECGIDKDESFDHPNHYEMLCIGVAYAKQKACIFGENSLTKTVYGKMKELFNSKKLVCQNGKFDLAGLYPHMGPLRLWFDTMLAHYCMDERPGSHGLKYLAVELLGAPQYDKELDQYLGKGRNYSSIPRPVLYKYNAYDVGVTWDLAELFEGELERLNLRSLHDFLCRASDQLMFLELNGIAIDKAVNDQLTVDLLAQMEELEEELSSYCKQDYDKRGGINPRSPKQIKEFFYDNGIVLPSTDVDHLEALLERVGGDIAKFIRTLLEHRRRTKLHGTYVKGIRNRLYRGRVYTTYRLHGTTSGRLASRNPNLQNIVRDKGIRRQFGVSRPGNILMQADYKQAEGRVMCTLAQDEYLRSIFNDPERDLFTELGKKLYNTDHLTKEQRIRVKAYFYGLGYGREPYSIAMEYGWSPREAEQDVAGFKRLIPGIVEWQDEIRRTVLSGKDLVTTFGRHRRFMLITKDNRKDVLNEALSFMPQSTASDICLTAFVELRPMLRGLGFVRLTIHDALVVECAESAKEEVAHLLTSRMLAAGREWTDYVPFEVDVSHGRSWGDL